jgi:metal-responsive CopG/Arc/MetJ family transcriptional regulator
MAATPSEVIVIRMSKQAVQRLDAAAHARGIKRSEFVRKVLESNLTDAIDIEEEARRQSLLVGRRESEKDALDFLENSMSTDGWK